MTREELLGIAGDIEQAFVDPHADMVKRTARAAAMLYRHIAAQHECVLERERAVSAEKQLARCDTALIAAERERDEARADTARMAAALEGHRDAIVRLRDERDEALAELASISAELGLPPTMRPVEGELARLQQLAASTKQLHKDLEDARAEVERRKERAHDCRRRIRKLGGGE